MPMLFLNSKVDRRSVSGSCEIGGKIDLIDARVEELIRLKPSIDARAQSSGGKSNFVEGGGVFGKNFRLEKVNLSSWTKKGST
jgi:hypothetical protein